MFGFRFTGVSGGDNFSTPEEFANRARHDINSHVKRIKEQGGFEKKKGLFHRRLSKAEKSTPSESLTYGSSPLRKTVSIDSFSDTSSMESASSQGTQGTESSFRMPLISPYGTNGSSGSSVSGSLFSGRLARIYTNSTAPTSVGMGSEIEAGNGATLGNSNSNSNLNSPSPSLSLNSALPKDFSLYYAQDLNVDRFSNGRPVYTQRKLTNWELNDVRSLLIYPELAPQWGPKVPQVVSPYPNVPFRIQIISRSSSDEEFARLLAQSDIYRESKFDLDFRLNTSRYIVEKARLRHRSILQSSFNVPDEAFDSLSNTVHNPEYDAFFVFEWRNVIENYMLNLGVESQCRQEFKERIRKLKSVNQHRVSCGGSDSLYKKVLSGARLEVDDKVKAEVWQDVQRAVYERLQI